jgi:poly(3-hydroxybutyrate) depolymerase
MAFAGAVLVGLTTAVVAPARAEIPAGRAEQTVAVGGLPIEVFTYRPEGCRISGLLVVFHGVDRNAATYRDHAVPAADRYCLLAVAPLFDAARFPGWSYQRGGVMRKGGMLPESEWTVGLVARLVDRIRAEERAPRLPVRLIGHSAGAQFLSRLAAYAPFPVERIVVADPSTWVEASTEIAVPFGFAGLDRPEAALRRYLALPLVAVVGAEDTGSKNLSTMPQARAQGVDRLDRTKNVFERARSVAAANGWRFGWRLVVVPGVAHDARRNFASPETLDALGR